MAIATKSQRLAALIAGAAFCGTLAMAQGGAQQSAAQPAAPPPFEQLYKVPAVYSVPGEEQVQVRRDIVYKTMETSPIPRISV